MFARGRVKASLLRCCGTAVPSQLLSPTGVFAHGGRPRGLCGVISRSSPLVGSSSKNAPSAVSGLPRKTSKFVHSNFCFVAPFGANKCTTLGIFHLQSLFNSALTNIHCWPFLGRPSKLLWWNPPFGRGKTYAPVVVEIAPLRRASLIIFKHRVANFPPAVFN